MQFEQIPPTPSSSDHTHTIDHWVKYSNTFTEFFYSLREGQVFDTFGEESDNSYCDDWTGEWYWYTPTGEKIGLAFDMGRPKLRCTMVSQAEIFEFFLFIFQSFNLKQGR